MKKTCYSFLFVFLGMSFGFSQQVPQFSQWFWHLQAINPAFSGIKPCLEIKSLYRNQWANLPGSPNSGFITLNLPIYTEQKKLLSPRQGIGFKFETDKIGAFSMNRFMVNYAGHFNFTPETRLSIGISAGAKQWIFNRDEMTTLEVDPVLQASASFIKPDAALGAWWNGKNYFLSFSMSELVPNKWSPLTNDSKYQIHSYFAAGTRLFVTEKITFLPYGMLRFPPKGPISMDLDLIFSYMNKFDFGIGFRNTDAINGFFQYKLGEKLALAYSLDYVISDLGLNRHFSHEFSLLFGSCKVKNTNKTVCPLF